MKFKDQIVWITGASSGIGRALAKACLEQGARIILSSRNRDELEKLKKESGRPEHCTVLPLDLADEASLEKAAAEVKEKFGRVDILFNNGGVSQRSRTAETSLEVDRRIMEINFFGSVSLTKKVLPWMLANNHGHIVVTSSVVGKFGFPLRSAYSASKHALQGFFDTLRAELAGTRIGITIVIAGRIHTDISINALNKNGEKHGVMDHGQSGGIPVDRTAREIIRAVRHNKKEVLIARKERIMVFLRRFLPFLYYKLASKLSPV